MYICICILICICVIYIYVCVLHITNAVACIRCLELYAICVDFSD